MQIENPIKLLRELKGPPLAVLMALAIVRQPVNAGWVEMVTGYGNQAITKALKLLVEYQYIRKISGQKWQIADSIQMPLMENHENQEFLPTTTNTIYEENEILSENKVIVEAKNHEKHDIYNRLVEIGVGEPMRSKLMNMEHMNIDYLNAHIERENVEKKGLGLLIYRLKMKDDAPKLNKNGHWIECKCDKCKYLR